MKTIILLAAMVAASGQAPSIVGEIRGLLRSLDTELARHDESPIDATRQPTPPNALTFVNGAYDPEFEFVIRDGVLDLELKKGNTMTDAVRLFVKLAHEQRISFTCKDRITTPDCPISQVQEDLAACRQELKAAKDNTRKSKDDWAVNF